MCRANLLLIKLKSNNFFPIRRYSSGHNIPNNNTNAFIIFSRNDYNRFTQGREFSQLCFQFHFTAVILDHIRCCHILFHCYNDWAVKATLNFAYFLIKTLENDFITIEHALNLFISLWIPNNFYQIVYLHS